MQLFDKSGEVDNHSAGYIAAEAYHQPGEDVQGVSDIPRRWQKAGAAVANKALAELTSGGQAARAKGRLLQDNQPGR